MGQKVNAWIGVRPLEPDAIQSLRDHLGKHIPKTFSAETDPHITILQCNIPEKHLDTLEMRARQLGLIGQSFKTNGLRCHPDPIDIEVVVLDVERDLSAARTELQEFIRNHNGEVLGDPAPPHITLWKAPYNTTVNNQTTETLTEFFANNHDKTDLEHTIGDVAVNTF